MFRDLLFKFLRAFNARFVFPQRARSLTRCLRTHLQDCRSILDVGCGNGRVGAQLATATGTTVEGCDVYLQSECVIPVVLYDGWTLPFADLAFDAVMFVDVLHHDLDPVRMVAEALRVTRGRVVVKDHYWERVWQRSALRFFDWIGNAPYGISVPYNFLRPEQWDQMFRDLGARVVVERRFRLYWHDPCTQVIYVIERVAHSHSPSPASALQN